MDFQVLDLMKSNDMKNYTINKCSKGLYMLRGTLWHVFPSMKNVVKNIANFTDDGDILRISQNFPPLESNFVGKNIIPNPDSILQHFNDYFVPLKAIYLEDLISKGNDNWFIGIFERSKK